MTSLSYIIRDNPVLTKELRVRMRGARAYWILTGYLAFLSLILFFQYTFWWNEAVRQGSGFSSGSKIGQHFFISIATVQAFLVAFITPAVTSGAITIEKEQRTLEMLNLTQISPVSVIVGKLFSAIGFVALLLISSLPLTSLCFFLGGVSPEQVIQSYLLLLAGSFVAGSLGLVWSSLARTTAAAVIFTYASLLVPILTGVVFLGTMMTRANYDDQIACALTVGIYGVPWPDTTGNLAPYFRAWDMRHYFGLALPTWVVPVLTYCMIGLLFCGVATTRLHPFPERKGRPLKFLLAAVFVQQLFFYFGGRFFVYYTSAPPGLAGQLSVYPLLTMLYYPVLLLLACIPVFSTADVSDGPKYSETGYASVESTRSKFRQSAMSGIPFLILLTGIVFGMYWASFLFVGQPGAAISGQIAVKGQTAPPLPMNPMQAWQIGPNGFRPGFAAVQAASDMGVVHVGIAVLATVLGLSALGYLFSVITRNRWVAMLLSYGVLVLIFIVPAVARGNYDRSDPSAGPSFLINLFYLNPMMSLSEITNVDGSFWLNMPLVLRPAPMWMTTTTLYLIIAVLAILISIPFATRKPSRSVRAV